MKELSKKSVLAGAIATALFMGGIVSPAFADTYSDQYAALTFGVTKNVTVKDVGADG